MRRCYALLTVATGNTKGLLQLPVLTVETWATEQSMDNDADTFSVDLGNVNGTLLPLLNRDAEVRVALFLDNLKSAPQQIFAGIADDVVLTEDQTLSIEGRDVPTALAVDTDAFPGWFNKFMPKQWIEKRALAVGISTTRIPKMSMIDRLGTDGSETEWALWYRVARMKGMYMWSDNLGRLIIDHLGYDLKPSYFFGHRPARDTKNDWLPIEPPLTYTSTKQSRKYKAIVFGEDAKAAQAGTAKKPKKTGFGIISTQVDPTIGSWKKKSLTIITSTTAKNQADLDKEAKEEIFESIVGAQEIQVVIRDTGDLIAQNMMARVNLPEYGLSNKLYFVVGVSRAAGPDGMTQKVRLREQNFALSERVPDQPAIASQTTAISRNQASVAAAIGGLGVPWASSFTRAANDYGVANGWDFAVFLGAMLAICQDETGFTNERQIFPGAINHKTWYKKPDGSDQLGIKAATPEHPTPTNAPNTTAAEVLIWQKTFANSGGNSLNPNTPDEAGVGPMQLTSVGDGTVRSPGKLLADNFGWNGVPRQNEYDGGRWNPDSNIRAAGALLAAKLKEVNADPTQADTIWAGVEAYNGGPDKAAYVARVKAIYNQNFAPTAPSSVADAVGSVQSLLPGSTAVLSTAPDGTALPALPANTPPEVRKAIAFCEARLGDPYEWGGDGPDYDCSGLVTAALNSGAQYLRNELGSPGGGVQSQRETTVTLWTKGRFQDIPKDKLRPGDLVFFDGDPPNHVGMYIGGGMMIDDPETGDVVHIVSLSGTWYTEHYVGARRVANWPTEAPQSTSSSPSGGNLFAPPSTPGGAAKKVMIQAGHVIPAGQSDEPYGHSGETGASGEQEFATSIRDKVLAHMSSDPRFNGVSGTAWDASAGATSSASDDINWTGDMFISIHYSVGSAGSGFLFGYTRGTEDGHTAALSAASAKLSDSIAVEIAKIPGSPARYTDNTMFGEEPGDPTGASGWGYYAWGSILRADPINQVDHTPGTPARIIFENGFADDAYYLTNDRDAIARAIYRGICSYYGFTPTGA